MAIYKNREVSVMSYVTNEDPVVEIMHQNGDRENVKLNEVQFTSDEAKELEKNNAVTNVTVIKDKDLNDLRDGQDVEKIKSRQEKESKNEDVQVNKLKVNVDEVNRKARI